MSETPAGTGDLNASRQATLFTVDDKFILTLFQTLESGIAGKVEYNHDFTVMAVEAAEMRLNKLREAMSLLKSHKGFNMFLEQQV